MLLRITFTHFFKSCSKKFATYMFKAMGESKAVWKMLKKLHYWQSMASLNVAQMDIIIIAITNWPSLIKITFQLSSTKPSQSQARRYQAGLLTRNQSSMERWVIPRCFSSVLNCWLTSSIVIMNIEFDYSLQRCRFTTVSQLIQKLFDIQVSSLEKLLDTFKQNIFKI